MGNEIELSEMALAAQREELKAEEEDFGKQANHHSDTPDPIKREDSKRKKTTVKKEVDLDKF